MNAEAFLRTSICLSLAIGFEEDRARLGLSGGVDRLRHALQRNDLWQAGDEELLARVLADEISPGLFCR